MKQPVSNAYVFTAPLYTGAWCLYWRACVLPTLCISTHFTGSNGSVQRLLIRMLAGTFSWHQ